MLVKKLVHIIICWSLVFQVSADSGQNSISIGSDIELDDSGEVAQDILTTVSESITDKIVENEINNLEDNVKNTLESAEFSAALTDFGNALDRPLNLTNNDRETLRKLGYTDNEIDNLTTKSMFDEKENLDKIQNGANKYVDQKVKDLKKEGQNNIIPGLASSVLGLAFAAVLGITVGVRCWSQPSAKVFAGTSAAWAALEVMIWNGYKVNMEDLDTVMKIPKIPKDLEAKFKKGQSLLKKIESEVGTLEIISTEELLDSQAENFAELTEITTDLIKYYTLTKDKQFNAIKGLLESLKLAAETTKKKARNATIAAVGYGTAAGVAAMEGSKVIDGNGACFVQNSSPFIQNLFNLLLPKAYANSNGEWVENAGLLDKIGLPVGGGMAAAYLGFEMKFADKIYATATSRAISFSAMAGIATLAAVKLKKGATYLYEIHNELEGIVKTAERLAEGKVLMLPSASEVIEAFRKEVVPKMKEIEEDYNEQENDSIIVSTVESAINEAVDDEVNQNLNNIATGVKNSLEDLISDELGEDSDSIENSLNEFIGNEDVENLINSNELISDVNSSRYPSFFQLLKFVLPKDAFAKVSTDKGSLEVKSSCFYKTRKSLKEDKTCQCLKKNQCADYTISKELNMHTSNQKELVSIYQNALNITTANKLILNGNSKKAMAIYKSAYRKTNDVNTITNKIISNVIKKPYTSKKVASLVSDIKKMTRKALPEYYKKNKVLKTLNKNKNKQKLLAQNINNQRKRDISSVKKKLYKHLQMAKVLKNPSLAKMELNRVISTRKKRLVLNNDNRSFDYNMSTVVKDQSASLFQIIRKRYLILMQSGRL